MIYAAVPPVKDDCPTLGSLVVCDEAQCAIREKVSIWEDKHEPYHLKSVIVYGLQMKIISKINLAYYLFDQYALSSPNKQ